MHIVDNKTTDQQHFENAFQRLFKNLCSTAIKHNTK